MRLMTVSIGSRQPVMTGLVAGSETDGRSVDCGGSASPVFVMMISVRDERRKLGRAAEDDSAVDGLTESLRNRSAVDGG